MKQLPLKGLMVLEFSQYLSGPSAGLRLADLGARVIKIERPQGGDPSRRLAVKNLWVGDDSLNFHAINRNKESFTADLKNPEDFERVKKLIRKADVVMHNFRPGVMEKVGLAYGDVRMLNPRIIYAEITGFGRRGPWAHRPGQDLLIQSLSGLTYTTGNGGQAPVPFGLSVVDGVCGIHLVQAVLGALIRRQKENRGAYIELSLLESAIGLQFELFTTFFHKKGSIHRSKTNNGNPLLGAPYGIYKTSDHYLSLAMMNIGELAKALDLEPLTAMAGEDGFRERDRMKELIARQLKTNTTTYWLDRLRQRGLWASEVYNWNELSASSGYRILQMEQNLATTQGIVKTTRCPIVLNGAYLTNTKAAPVLGADNAAIEQELTDV